jgi:preprotein translocase subunit SecD
VNSILFLSLALQFTACNRPPKIEEVGGYRITYALRSAKPGDQQMAIGAIQRRLDAIGLRGGMVAKSGNDKVEISLPGIGAEEFEKLQDLIVTPGHLEFRILAQQGTHDELIASATATPTSPDDTPNEDQDPPTPKSKWVRFDPSMLDLPARAIQRTVDDRLEVLIVLDDKNIDNSFMGSVSVTIDSVSNPAIAGRLLPAGAERMRKLTTANLPEGNVYQSLGVVVDDRLLVAPRIQAAIGDAFMLTGDFSMQEAEFIVAVLRTGRLPVEFNPEPIKVDRVMGTRE